MEVSKRLPLQLSTSDIHMWDSPPLGTETNMNVDMQVINN